MVILKGSGNINSVNGELPVHPGDSVLVPCAVGVEITGGMNFLKISI